MIHYYKYSIDILSHVNAEHEQTRRDDIVYDLDHAVLTVKWEYIYRFTTVAWWSNYQTN